MPLKLKSASAVLLNSRPKREGGEKGKITAMFLKFEGPCNKSNLKALLNTEEPPELWEADGRKVQKWPHMTKFSSNVQYEGAKVTFLGHTLTDCIIRNIVIEPQEGNIIFVSFEVKAHPTKALLGTFESDLLGEQGKLDVDANILLDPNPQSDEDEEEEEEDDDQNKLPLDDK